MGAVCCARPKTQPAIAANTRRRNRTPARAAHTTLQHTRTLTHTHQHTSTHINMRTHTTQHRYMKREHIVRPHIAELLRLLPHFRLGVFSSATTRTVRTALQALGATLRHEAAQRGIGE